MSNHDFNIDFSSDLEFSQFLRQHKDQFLYPIHCTCTDNYSQDTPYKAQTNLKIKEKISRYASFQLSGQTGPFLAALKISAIWLVYYFWGWFFLCFHRQNRYEIGVSAHCSVRTLKTNSHIREKRVNFGLKIFFLGPKQAKHMKFIRQERNNFPTFSYLIKILIVKSTFHMVTVASMPASLAPTEKTSKRRNFFARLSARWHHMALPSEIT